jgi:hypothetical protein
VLVLARSVTGYYVVCALPDYCPIGDIKQPGVFRDLWLSFPFAHGAHRRNQLASDRKSTTNGIHHVKYAGNKLLDSLR